MQKLNKILCRNTLVWSIVFIFIILFEIGDFLQYLADLKWIWSSFYTNGKIYIYLL